MSSAVGVKMRVLVCGGRDYDDAEALSQFMDELAQRITIDAVIDGDARGADTIAGQWACRRGIENIKFHAEWQKLGRKAGPIRNQLMLDEGSPDVVVAFPGGRGTADMITRARSAGVEVIQAVGQTGGTPIDPADPRRNGICHLPCPEPVSP